MAKARPRHFPPPLKGLEWRDVFQDTEGEAITADCMINVETSYGELRERDGFEYVADCPEYAQIHATDHPNRAKLLITVGLQNGTTRLLAHVYNMSTGVTTSTNLSGLTNETWFSGFRCSFIDVRLPGGNDLAFNSTLIVTPSFTYCVNLDGTVRVVNMNTTDNGGDCIRLNSLNFGYHLTVPRGPIAVEHADKIFYMGWGEETQFVFTSTVEDQQSLIPEIVLNKDRGSYTLGSDWLIYSDEFAPLDIQAHHALRVENREEITGAASFKDVLVIFTDISMYVLLGATDANFQLRKIDSGVGCVSHWSIVEANGMLYFMARDGVYVFDGSKVQKASVGIDQLWSDEPRPGFVPSRFRTRANSLGWPFNLSRTALSHVNCVHFAERSLLLWSLPVSTRTTDKLPVTLVHDYKHGGFYFWSMADFTVTGPLTVTGTCMYDGVAVIDRGKETLYTTGFIRLNGGIRKYGSQSDKPAPSEEQGIPFIWTTGRIDKNVMGTSRIQSVRFSVRARGSSYSGTHDVAWAVYDATTQHQPGLEELYNTLPMYPPALLDDATMTGTSSPLLGTGQLGSMKITSVEYFKSKGGGCRSTDGSLRVVLFCAADGTKDTNLRMNAWAFEYDRGDTR